MRYELRFGLLGTPVLFDPVDDDAVHPVGSPKVRVLLAALLLEPGRVVSVDALKDALWGGSPPASAHASLHNHVTRLRRLLDDPDRLRAVPPGYVLRVDEGELDVHVFEAHVAAARTAHAAKDWPATVRACTAALALWRGTPLSGVPAELGGYAFAQRLTEARLLALEWCYDAELALGGPRLGALVPELAALVADHPLRESYHRQLMLALHHTGRQAEALAVHRDLRNRLIEELGIEPGAGVRGAHVEVLRGVGVREAARQAGEERPQGATARDGEVPQRARAREARAEMPQGTEVREAWDLPRGAAGVRGAGAERGADAGHIEYGGRVGDAGLIEDGGRVEDAGLIEDAGHSGAPGRVGVVEAACADEPMNVSGAPSAPDVPTASHPAAPDSRGQPAPHPAQLPPPPAHFTGRTETSHALHDTLAPLSADPGAQPLAVITVITGMAGVGKSALALHTAHALRSRFPDGQLYVNLHGATPGMTPLASGQALHALLRDLGAEPRHIPEHPDAASALLRSLLAPTRTLMVLDDAENAAQVRPLLPAGASCAVIVTSRSPLTALDGARRFPLTPLSGEDSAALLRAVSGRDGLDAAHPLVELTGRLPLALRIVAARLAARHALTPDVLAGQLAATESRLRHLEYDDLSVRRSLAVAHDALAASDRETDRDAARTLHHIGTLDLPAYGAPLLARLADTDERRAEAALDRLVDVALLEETSYGRYAPHDLVRDFARELAEREGELEGEVGKGGDRGGKGALVGADLMEAPLSEVTPAATDLIATALAWYAAHAERTLTAIVEPGLDQDDRRRPTAAQPPGHPTEVAATTPFPRPEDAFAWGDLELENVVALVTRYRDTLDLRRTAHVSTLVRLLFPYVLRSGRVAETEVLGRAALGAARRLGDAAAEAYALGDLAGLHFLTGRQNEALVLNDQALAIWWRLDAVSWIRRCLNNRGLLLEGLGRYAESGVALRQSLAHSRQLDDPYGEAVTHSHLGNLYEHTDPRAAIEQHRRSLAIGDEIGAVIVQHSAHCNIGYAHLTLGEPAAAVPHFEESLRILGGHGDWHGESQTRLGLVRALRLLGRTEDIRTEDIRTEDVRTEDIRTEDIRTEDARTERARTEDARTERARTEDTRTERARTEDTRTEGARTERARTERADTEGTHTEPAHTTRAHTECAELLRRADARADRYMGGLARHQLGLLLREQGREHEAYDAWWAALDALDGTDEKVVVRELGELLSQCDARRPPQP
ncbi:BTAD domain-containing putative transcriptional regulator [Streptomyces sp. NBC_00986]|uniref:AfsR/SARP family transcriptional regulator n=1 Tax=Streptomyces sp. NBC_00986 TaxID=2903702 RepID=UPI00386751DE|nr:tetratricopeptide repeat protein [Streptomyces sp. NBC_00986]